ncbi:MAG: hypothetical protein K1X29_00065 [Bdellovibrionales bacterium]|nr:hypothetical protein [Bdellovibrionales bacterium]
MSQKDHSYQELQKFTDSQNKKMSSASLSSVSFENHHSMMEQDLLAQATLNFSIEDFNFPKNLEDDGVPLDLKFQKLMDAKTFTAVDYLAALKIIKNRIENQEGLKFILNNLSAFPRNEVLARQLMMQSLIEVYADISEKNDGDLAQLEYYSEKIINAAQEELMAVKELPSDLKGDLESKNEFNDLEALGKYKIYGKTIMVDTTLSQMAALDVLLSVQGHLDAKTMAMLSVSSTSNDSLLTYAHFLNQENKVEVVNTDKEIDVNLDL